MAKKYELLSDEETAKILGISKAELYNLCSFFDSDPNDPWALVEGRDFEWVGKAFGFRRFYESGAMAIAEYLQQVDYAGKFGFCHKIFDALTQRRKRIKQALVRRKVIEEFDDLSKVTVENGLVFMHRGSVIRILGTNGKGLNSSANRIQDNPSLDGVEPLKIDADFKIDPNANLKEDPKDPHGVKRCIYWSQTGIAKVAKDLSGNFGKKKNEPRKEWTEAVAAVIEDVIVDQRKHLESSASRIQAAVNRVRAQAKGHCQVTKMEQSPVDPFQLHVHHLFDRATRPDLAAHHDNLIAIRGDIHTGFHDWHGRSSCEPRDFANYLSTIELWRFEGDPEMEKHLQKILNRLARLQKRCH